MRIEIANQTEYKGLAYVLVSSENRLRKLNEEEISYRDIERVTGQESLCEYGTKDLQNIGDKHFVMGLIPPNNRHIVPRLTSHLTFPGGAPNLDAVKEQEYLILGDKVEDPSIAFMLSRTLRDPLRFEIIRAVKEICEDKKDEIGEIAIPLKILFGYAVDKSLLKDDARIEALKRQANERRQKERDNYFQDRDEESRRIEELANKSLLGNSNVTIAQVPSVSAVVLPPHRGNNPEKELLQILGLQKASSQALLVNATKLVIRHDQKQQVIEWINRNRSLELAQRLSNNPSLMV